jgi:hypothetical protein
MNTSAQAFQAASIEQLEEQPSYFSPPPPPPIALFEAEQEHVFCGHWQSISKVTSRLQWPLKSIEQAPPEPPDPTVGPATHVRPPR